MSPPVPMLLDDDDVARMRRENAVLVDLRPWEPSWSGPTRNSLVRM